MFKKKIQYQEDNKIGEKDENFKMRNKRKMKYSLDKNDPVTNKIQTEDKMLYPIRGRQPNNDNFSNYNNIKEQNNSLAINCDCKRKKDNKNEVMTKKINANPGKLQFQDNKTLSDKKMNGECLSMDNSISDDSNNGNINKEIFKERWNNIENETNNNNQITKSSKNLQLADSKFAFDESQEIEMNIHDDYSSRGLIYNIDENNSFEKMENFNNDIEKILIDVYNSHIKSDKANKALDISKYEGHITSLSLSSDYYYNLVILQIFEEKIKELIERYKEKILEIPEISSIKKKYSEIKKSLKIQNKKYSEKLLICRKQTSTDLNDQIRSVMNILLVELRNIKNALINASADLKIIFRAPLEHLSVDGKIEVFSIEDMHKEEFFNTLIEDEFISCILNHTKNIAAEYKIDEIIILIENLENDAHDYTMSNFSFFIDEKLKEFLENGSDSNIPVLNSIANTPATNTNNSKSSANTYCILKGTLEQNSFNTTKTNIENLDDLVAYINSNDKPTKKSKKKNLKKKNTNNKHKNGSALNSIDHIDDEIIIENFKKNIYSQSRFAGSTRKIKPVFSMEWINSLKL